MIYFQVFVFACARTEGGQAKVISAGGPSNLRYRLCSGALSLYDGEDEIMVMMYDAEQTRVHISIGNFLDAGGPTQSNRTFSQNDHVR
jgi:hypothetical protein